MTEPLKRALLIVNPQAGRLARRPAANSVLHSLGERGYETAVFTTAAPREAAGIVAKHGVQADIVVCCGGDGTFNEVLSGVMGLPRGIPIGYVPTGTTNDLARTLGIPTKAKNAIRAMLEGTPAPHDVGRINGSAYFSYIASFGAFTKVAYATPQWLKNRFGRLAYLIDGVKSVGEIRPQAVTVRADGFRAEGTFLFGSVTNAKSIGGVLRLSDSDVRLDDGEFEVLLIRDPQNPADLRSILYGLRRRKYDRRHICFLHARRVELEFDRETAWTADGEYAGTHRFVGIENLRGAVRIIRPPCAPR